MTNPIFTIVFSLLVIIITIGLIIIIRNGIKISGTFKSLKKSASDNHEELSKINLIFHDDVPFIPTAVIPFPMKISRGQLKAS